MNQYGALVLQILRVQDLPALTGQFKHAEKGQFSFLSEKASSFADKVQPPLPAVTESTFSQSQFIKGCFPFFLLQNYRRIRVY